MKFFVVMGQLSCIAGGLVFVGTMLGAKSAPQEAAGFAMAATLAIVPYCFVRLLEINDELARRKRGEAG